MFKDHGVGVGRRDAGCGAGGTHLSHVTETSLMNTAWSVLV